MNESTPVAAEAALKNLGHFEAGYVVLWAILFIYLIFLYRKLCRLEKGKS